MGGSGRGGIANKGSSAGCQRSMLSIEAPSDELPKNRLAVLTEKPSRGGLTAATAASGAPFESVNGWISSDIESSYCGYCGHGGGSSRYHELPPTSARIRLRP